MPFFYVAKCYKAILHLYPYLYFSLIQKGIYFHHVYKNTFPQYTSTPSRAIVLSDIVHQYKQMDQIIATNPF